MISSNPSTLLLIPAHNEEHRIEPVLREYASYFEKHYAGPFQMVVVLNGCTDRTADVVMRVASDHSQITALNFPGRIGKGGALIEGLKLAPSTELIGYVDADGATPASAYLQLMKQVDGADCVIGSRWMPGSIIHQSQSNKRRFISRVFHAVVQILFLMNIRDTQCGAKVMRREAVERIHPMLRIADMAFDINLLYALKREGYTIKEVPTEWTDKFGSKVVVGRTSLSMLLSVIRLRLVYSPFYAWLRPFRPIESWLYKKLAMPAPLPARRNRESQGEPADDERKHRG